MKIFSPLNVLLLIVTMVFSLNSYAQNYGYQSQNSYLSYLGHNKYSYGGREINKTEAKAMIQSECAMAYPDFKKGDTFRTTGITMLGVGGGLFVTGVVELLFTSVVGGASMMGAGAVLMGTSGAFFSKSKKYKIKSCNSFNQCDREMSLNFQVTGNGFGLALNF
ncbi:MAG: hypothetical protein J6S84_06685 [Bacteroidales bacterium]|nr:hypothetical protein [Bacteroidales bacterium]